VVHNPSHEGATDEDIILKLRKEVEYEQVSVEEAIEWTVTDLKVPEDRVRAIAVKLFGKS